MALHFEPLDSMLIERGTVQKCLLFQQEYFTVAVLVLSPGSKIKKHPHFMDNEKYVFETGEVQLCLKGEEHELENPTNGNMTVLAIKWA